MPIAMSTKPIHHTHQLAKTTRDEAGSISFVVTIQVLARKRWSNCFWCSRRLVDRLKKIVFGFFRSFKSSRKR